MPCRSHIVLKKQYPRPGVNLDDSIALTVERPVVNRFLPAAHLEICIIGRNSRRVKNAVILAPFLAARITELDLSKATILGNSLSLEIDAGC